MVIKQRVAELDLQQKFPTEVREYLERTLTEMKNRTYLWLRLVFDGLPQSWPSTVSETKEVIATLPKGIDEAYESLLNKCGDPNYARRVLKIVLAAYRPLSLDEIDTALRISERTSSLDNLDLTGSRRLREVLPALCGFVITIIDSEVFFIHQSIKEFLLRDLQDSDRGSHTGRSIYTSQAPAWRGSFAIEEAHSHLALSCMRVLLL